MSVVSSLSLEAYLQLRDALMGGAPPGAVAVSVEFARTRGAAVAVA